MDTAVDIIELMSSAKFEVTNARFLGGSCDKPEHHSVFRGYQIFKLAYFIFTSKLERGWYDPVPKNYSIDRVGLTNPNRMILLRFWPSDSIDKFIKLTSRLSNLPKSPKADLKAFLGKLRDFKQYYGFLGRRPNELKFLEERAAEQCSSEKHHYLEALEKGQSRDYIRDKILDRTSAKSDLERCEARRLDTIEKEIKAYRELINTVRDPNTPIMSACLDGSSDYYGRTYLGKNGAISKQSQLHPNHYMLFFWKRRQSEGTTTLAMYLLKKAIAALD